MNLTRLLNEVKSPKSGSLIARSSLTASSSSAVVAASEMKKTKNDKNVEMRKRKLNGSPAHEEQPKKPFLMANQNNQTPVKSQIPRIKKKDLKEEWLNTYQSWNDNDQKEVLLKLIELSHPNIVRYMREVIEPRFQRDFISLLP